MTPSLPPSYLPFFIFLFLSHQLSFPNRPRPSDCLPPAPLTLSIFNYTTPKIPKIRRILCINNIFHAPRRNARSTELARTLKHNITSESRASVIRIPGCARSRRLLRSVMTSGGPEGERVIFFADHSRMSKRCLRRQRCVRHIMK